MGKETVKGRDAASMRSQDCARWRAGPGLLIISGAELGERLKWEGQKGKKSCPVSTFNERSDHAGVKVQVEEFSALTQLQNRASAQASEISAQPRRDLLIS